MPINLLRGALVRGALVSGCLAVSVPAHGAADWVSIKTLPGFGDANAQLQALVDTNGHQTVNRLCVIGRKDGAHFQAEVYWPSENKLILWVPNINDPETLVHSRRYLDLKRDVRSDVGTSTYILSRSFVNETLMACASKGDHFVINKASRPVPNNG